MNRTLGLVSGIALGVFLLATVRLGLLEQGPPTHMDLVLPGGVPATLYLPREETGRFALNDPPPPDARPPAIAMMHGFAGDRRAMSGLARRLAQSGYAVLSFDASGHGRNRNPYTRDRASGNSFHGDFSAAVDYLRTSPHVDGSRIVVMGHSMGAGAALDYATRDSGLDAAVLVSGGWQLFGPYRPPNALFLYAAGDPERIRLRSDELAARIAGVSEVERGRSYGDPARGTGLRVVEVPGVDHQTIAWSSAAVGEIRSWLDGVFGRERGPEPIPSDPRGAVLLIQALAMLFLLPGLGAVAGRLVPARAAPAAGGEGLGLLGVAVALLAAMPLLSVGPPGALLGVEVGDVVVSWFALAGVALLAGLAVAGRLERPLLRELPRALPGAAVAVLAIFVLQHAMAAATHDVALTPERAIVFVAASLGFLPFALAFQQLLRRGPTLRATLSGLAGRFVVILVLAAGGMTGVVSSVILFMLPAFALVMLLMEVLAASLYAASHNRMAIALVDAAWLALVVAAIMPIRF